jgi:hypothetical protein
MQIELSNNEIRMISIVSPHWLSVINKCLTNKQIHIFNYGFGLLNLVYLKIQFLKKKQKPNNFL